MPLTLTSPAALWLLAAVPLVWLAHLVARTNFNRRQRIAQAAVRSLIIAALAVGFSRPVISSSSSRQSLVYLVDVSHSVSTGSVDAAARKIDELNAALRPAHVRIVAFGGTAAVVATTQALRQLAPVEPGAPGRDGPRRGGTDLEMALQTARGEIAPGHVPRIVLFTDGHATAGDASATIARLAAERIPVFVEPAAPRAIGDTWVDRLELTSAITAGAPFTATVSVASQRDAAGVLELTAGDTVLARRPAAFARGVTSVPLEGVLEAQGAYVLRASLIIEGDPLAANNSLAREIWAGPRPKVLYVEGTPASARYLAGALRGSGFDVTVRPPSGLPASAADLDTWDVVILSDVRRTALPEPAVSALVDWVENGGGGLLVAGGEAVFGEAGYRNTAIERLTPVTFERRDEPEVALVLVLDRSWSMAGSSMELTKTAAQAAVDVLEDHQSVGILTFNDKFAWDVTVRNVGTHRELIRSKIAEIGPGGHTLIYPAVEQAYLALRDAEARAKHVILLSDGRSYPGEYQALVQRMVEAHITVSTVAVGPSADPELLKNIAEWGKGRAYVVGDAAQVVEIFVKEAKAASTPSFDERTIKPVVKTPGFLTGVDLATMPALRGRTATVLKEDALELLATDEDDPLLAFWPIGLGRTAVFASDVKDRWAADWITWRGYGPFFASVVRTLQRQRPPAITLDVDPGPIRGTARTITVGVEARDAGGGYRNLLDPTILVGPVPPRSGAAAAPSPPPTQVVARQVAPGRYEATVVADALRPLTIALAAPGETTGVTSRTILPDPAAEYRFRPPDERLLRSIAAATGGTWRPDAGALGNAAGDLRAHRRPVWPALIVLALVLWFADLLLRRIRLFEPDHAA